jgi:ribosome-binding protein aMBF1 (putative translation factor)
MVDTQLLEEAIKSSGIKKSYLADKLGISIQSLRLKVKGKSDFKTDEASILCQELGITRLTDKEKIFCKM